MKTVKVKIKGTNTILEGSICDDSLFVSVDHDIFERYSLDEIEICKDSLQVPETCKENIDSFTSLKEAAHHIAIEALNDTKFMTTTMGYVLGKLQDIFIAGAEWQKKQMMKDLEEDVLLLERVCLTLYNLGHEELAERLKTFKEKYANKM